MCPSRPVFPASLDSTIHHFPHRFPNPHRRRAAAMAPPPPPPPPPPALMIDVVSDILLRIPPDDPAHLLRASLVCKPWHRLLTDPAFHRRYRAFHRKPIVLGFFLSTSSYMVYPTARFVPTSTFRPRYPERRKCRVLDCRHGRVLFFEGINGGRLLVWDPINGEDHLLPINKIRPDDYNAAILCAAADCDHLGCHGGPFLVVLVSSYYTTGCAAWVYSSDAGEWSPPSTVGKFLFLNQRAVSPVLTGDKIYFACEYGEWILRCDLQDNGRLSLFNGPSSNMYSGFALIPVVDGGLRLAGMKFYELSLWSLEMMDANGVAAWTQLCVITLESLLEITYSQSRPRLIGFRNGPAGDVVFVGIGADVFTVELESHKIKKVDDIDFNTDFRDEDLCEDLIFPYTSFVTPVCCGEIVTAAAVTLINQVQEGTRSIST